MKVLFFEPYACWVPHYGTCLELVQNHFNNGDEIYLLNCDSSIENCDINIEKNQFFCGVCKSRKRKGLIALGQSIREEHFENLTVANLKEIKKIEQKNFRTIKELESFKIDNFDIGLAVLSSLISKARNPYLNIDQHQENIRSLVISSYKSYCSMMNHLNIFKPDCVYIFNGRFSLLKAAMRACEKKSVKFFIHERGSDNNKYMLYENHMPHSISNLEKLIDQYWNDDTITVRKKAEEADKFYIQRSKGIIKNWNSFTINQEEDLLPKTWDDSKENIVFYNSSEDEYASIGEEWKMTLFDSQIHAMKEILAHFADNINYQFYLRVHPNIAEANKKVLEEIYYLQKYSNLIIIPPDSPINTYALMFKSSKVLTFGSTMGIESAYWRKPSICLEKSFYLNLGSVYVPKSKKETIELIGDTNLPPLEINGALKYGYYLNTFGIEYKYYRSISLFKGSFNGKTIRESFYHKAMRSLDYRLGKLLPAIKSL